MRLIDERAESSPPYALYTIIQSLVSSGKSNDLWHQKITFYCIFKMEFFKNSWITRTSVTTSRCSPPASLIGISLILFVAAIWIMWFLFIAPIWQIQSFWYLNWFTSVPLLIDRVKYKKSAYLRFLSPSFSLSIWCSGDI